MYESDGKWTKSSELELTTMLPDDFHFGSRTYLRRKKCGYIELSWHHSQSLCTFMHSSLTFIDPYWPMFCRKWSHDCNRMQWSIWKALKCNVCNEMRFKKRFQYLWDVDRPAAHVWFSGNGAFADIGFAMLCSIFLIYSFDMLWLSLISFEICVVCWISETLWGKLGKAARMLGIAPSLMEKWRWNKRRQKTSEIQSMLEDRGLVLATSGSIWRDLLLVASFASFASFKHNSAGCKASSIFTLRQSHPKECADANLKPSEHSVANSQNLYHTLLYSTHFLLHWHCKSLYGVIIVVQSALRVLFFGFASLCFSYAEICRDRRS